MCPHGVSVHPRRYTMRDHPTSFRPSSYTRNGAKRSRRRTIVAIARKLLIALWRDNTSGLVPNGTRMSRAGVSRSNHGRTRRWLDRGGCALGSVTQPGDAADEHIGCGHCARAVARARGAVWGDAGYQGVGKREGNRDTDVDWPVAMKAGKRRERRRRRARRRCGRRGSIRSCM